jgi:Xaa-Pro aminopeptidase
MKLDEMMSAKRIDALLLSSWNRLDINSSYISGCDIEHHFLLLRNGRKTLLLPNMEMERGRKADARRIEIGKDLKKQLGILLQGVKRLGLNLSLISVNEHKLIRKAYKGRIADVSRLLLEARREKTPREIALYRRACALTDKVMQKTLNSLGGFRTEDEVYRFLRDETERLGCTFSFEPIIASGRKASMPHADKRGRLERGFCVIDYGLKYKGYCTDITRTAYIGRPSQQDIALYDKVLSVQQKAISMCKGFTKCSEVHDYARKELGKRFNHGLGHGIGLQIHELPNISLASKERFSDGMVFTIEPGYYIPGKLGIRIEDDILIKDGKPVVLTRTSRELIMI